MTWRFFAFAILTTLAIIGLLHIAHANSGGWVVVDGDTIKNTVTRERVRLENVDAPEMKARCSAELQLARRATAMTAALLANHEVAIHRIGRLDRYGRTLALVEIVDVGDLGRELMRLGLAREYHGGKRAGWCR